MFPKPTNYFAGKQMSDPIPQWNEQDRLKAIDSYHILDTPREEEFDDIVKLAAEACNVPVSLISFVTSGRQWFKAAIGTELEETSLDSSICSHAILQKGVFVVPDTTKDPRTQNNPLVAGDPKVRFYAGALLETSEGLPLGTVCVLDFPAPAINRKRNEGPEGTRPAGDDSAGAASNLIRIAPCFEGQG